MKTSNDRSTGERGGETLAALLGLPGGGTARDPLLPPREAGAVLHKPVATLTDWRYRGYGPEYVRQGRSIYYRLSALERWIEAHTVRPGDRHGAA